MIPPSAILSRKGIRYGGISHWAAKDMMLLRLQEIWLAKFVTVGLVMPGVALARNRLPTSSGVVVSLVSEKTS